MNCITGFNYSVLSRNTKKVVYWAEGQEGLKDTPEVVADYGVYTESIDVDSEGSEGHFVIFSNGFSVFVPGVYYVNSDLCLYHLIGDCKKVVGFEYSYVSTGISKRVFDRYRK